MTTTFDTRELRPMALSTGRVSSLLEKCRRAIQERRERQRVRVALDYLSDTELRDIGITRGEIDYVACNRSLDPRAIRSAELV
jgi:uncharacterized protein YjiS (DUF1127 family)